MLRGLSSLESRMVLLLGLAGVSGALVYAGVTQWPLPQMLVWMRQDMGLDLGAPAHFSFYGALIVSVVLLLPLAFWLGHRVMSPSPSCCARSKAPWRVIAMAISASPSPPRAAMSWAS